MIAANDNQPTRLSFVEFMRNRLGPRWFVARRSKHFGLGVTLISRKRYAALEAEYEAIYGCRWVDRE